MSQRRFSKALLMNPPTGLYRRDDRCQSKVEDQTVQIIFPPMELATLAAVLRERGAEVRIADYPATGGSWDAYLTDLRAWQPDLVLLNVVTATAERDFQALDASKETLGRDRVLTVARGELMDASGEQAPRGSPRSRLRHVRRDRRGHRTPHGRGPA